MFKFFYQIAIFKTYLAFLISKKLSKRLRKFHVDRSRGRQEKPGQYKYWIHCASYGEYEMAIPVIDELIKEVGVQNLLLSFFSPSGYKQAIKNELLAEQVIYLPLDRRSAVKRFYGAHQIEKAIFIRYELWYNFLQLGLSKGVKFYLINSRLSSKHFIMSWLAGPYRKLLKKFDYIFTSDKRTKKLLEKKGVKPVLFTGDTRYDRVKQIQENAEGYKSIESFKGEQHLLILGSSYFYEEGLLEQVLYELSELKVIIAPHNINEDRILELETRFSAYHPQLWSAGDVTPDSQLLILDSMGMLSSVYQYADISVVGGGFTGALHNIIEPAVWGSSIVFGPSYQKFPEANAFIEEGFAYSVKDQEEFFKLLSSLLENKDSLEANKQKAESFVSERLGASLMILDHLKS